ncbi:hypothetical protein J7438_15000 [Thalassotalea sp. G20_0]|uniref:hypothetical protein n=1 Tax=Thalassotalea sp. G20_0 TaxID=2821093 RepID=UPI001ADADF70|nr:hypothetical protein [Thalassotalea sp. G20_0]MBO9495385.1 hypothetical protein [Thalassotalea sp. G20_0]
MAFDLETCRSKDELESFARQMFNVELDKRKKLDELKDEVRLLMNGGDPLVKQEEPEEATQPSKGAKKPLQFVLNKNTNSVFIYNPRLKKRMGVDLEFCDQQGNRL